MRILVVDDDPAGVDLRKLILERHGHVVSTALDVGQARRAFRDTAPEAVTLDLRLPEPEDGLDLIREFRAASPSVRIIVFTGYSGAIEGREEQSMVDAVLEKPARLERLLEALRGSPPPVQDPGE